jgi:hypothetical protein
MEHSEDMEERENIEHHNTIITNCFIYVFLLFSCGYAQLDESICSIEIILHDFLGRESVLSRGISCVLIRCYLAVSRL